MRIYSNTQIDTTTGTGEACHIIRETELVRVKGGIEYYRTIDWYANPTDHDEDVNTPDVILPIIKDNKPYVKRTTLVNYNQAQLNAMEVAFAPHLPNGLTRQEEKLWKVQHALWLDTRGKTYDENGAEIDIPGGSSYMATNESIWIKE